MISIPSEMKMLEKKIPVYQPEELRSIRARHGLSRSDLAELLDVNRSTVSRWESEDECPRLAALAYHVLEKVPNLLLNGEEGIVQKEVYMSSTSPSYVLLRTSHRPPKKEWGAEDIRSFLRSVGENFYLKDLARVSGLSAPTVATWTAAKRPTLPRRTTLWLNLLWSHRFTKLERCGSSSSLRLSNGEELMPSDVLAFTDNEGHFFQECLVEEGDEPNSLRIVKGVHKKVDAKKIRQSLNMTQDQIATIFGVSTLLVKNWEKTSVDDLKGPGLRLYDFVQTIGLPSVKMFENLA